MSKLPPNGLPLRLALPFVVNDEYRDQLQMYLNTPPGEMVKRTWSHRFGLFGAIFAGKYCTKSFVSPAIFLAIKYRSRSPTACSENQRLTQKLTR